LRAALSLYEDRPAWRRLQLRAISRDFSWGNAARRYIELYQRAVSPSGASRSGTAK
jgi:glycogen synthase